MAMEIFGPKGQYWMSDRAHACHAAHFATLYAHYGVSTQDIMDASDESHPRWYRSPTSSYATFKTACGAEINTWGFNEFVAPGWVC